jgi:hypothetical protein
MPIISPLRERKRFSASWPLLSAGNRKRGDIDDLQILSLGFSKDLVKRLNPRKSFLPHKGRDMLPLLSVQIGVTGQTHGLQSIVSRGIYGQTLLAFLTPAPVLGSWSRRHPCLRRNCLCTNDPRYAFRAARDLSGADGQAH